MSQHPTVPSREARLRSQRVSECIAHAIKKVGGCLSFADYMDYCLYATPDSYYCSDQWALGKEGDFTTAPERSDLFSRCIAASCHPLLKQVRARGKSVDMIEFGAGSGRMAAVLLQTFDQLGCMPNVYRIVEISKPLQARQRAWIKQQVPQYMDRMVWSDTLPEGSYNGIILANEVLDAMPFHRFEQTKYGVLEQGVTQTTDGFAWRLRPAQPPLKQALEQIEQLDLPIGYASDIHLQWGAFLAKLARQLQSGMILFIDYGCDQKTYYHPDRKNGTLRCYYKHHMQDNPFLWPGLQDITAHVDFTRVADCAKQHGLEVWGYTHQAAFLMDCGILEMDQSEPASQVSSWQMRQTLKHLLLPSEMGEIKCMALRADQNSTLRGFDYLDLAGRL